MMYTIVIVNRRIMLRYFDEYDLTPVLTCIAVAGALARAENRGYGRGYSAARLIWKPAEPENMSSRGEDHFL